MFPLQRQETKKKIPKISLKILSRSSEKCCSDLALMHLQMYLNCAPELG